MNVKSEIIKRLAALLLNGFTVQQVKDKLLNGEISNKDFPDSLADKYIEDALKLLEVDIGQDQKLQYPRLVHLYNLCLEKKDYTNAAKVWKEIQTFSKAGSSEEIVINFIKS